MNLTGNFTGKADEALIVAISQAYLATQSASDRLGDYVAQMPFMRRSFPSDFIINEDGSIDLTQGQETFLYHALLRIGPPVFQMHIDAITDRSAFSDAVVRGAMKFVELNPMQSRQYRDYNAAVLAACPLVNAWLQLAD